MTQTIDTEFLLRFNLDKILFNRLSQMPKSVPRAGANNVGEYLEIKKGGKIQSVKLGTCEDLYYSTYPQFLKVLPNFQDQQNAKEYLKSGIFRFRFPFPDEKVSIGEYADFNRGIRFSVPKSLGIEMCHTEMMTEGGAKDRTQYDTLRFGMRTPCFQTPEFGLQVTHYDWNSNAQRTHFEIIQQKIIMDDENEKQLQTVIRCPYCGAGSRLSYEEVCALVRYSNAHPEYFDPMKRAIIAEAFSGYVRFKSNPVTKNLTAETLPALQQD